MHVAASNGHGSVVEMLMNAGVGAYGKRRLLFMEKLMQTFQFSVQRSTVGTANRLKVRAKVPIINNSIIYTLHTVLSINRHISFCNNKVLL